MVACFHPDATLVTSAGRTLQGRHELSEFFGAWVSSAPPTKHECSDHHPIQGTDWILSRCRSRVVRSDSDIVLLVANYHDVLVRDGERWLIGSRLVSPSTTSRDTDSPVEVDP